MKYIKKLMVLKESKHDCIISIPITLVSVVFTVYFYRKGYRSSRDMKEPFNRAIVLTFFSLPFNLVMAFYLTGVMIFFYE